ncbi:MAG: NCS2 family permease [Negativicutes bacterium]|nr:NCS2 family permease [Negativicutes bacterium]
MDKFFKISARGSSLTNEVIAGLTVFVTAAYSVVVIPAVLSDAGISFSGAMIATVLAATAATLMMAFFANLPILVGCGLGTNAFITYNVVVGMGLPWQSALGAAFVAGALFVMISLSRFRSKIFEILPVSLKAAITAGIGFFIAFIGLQKGKLIVAGPNLVRLGNLSDPLTLLTMFGLLISLILVIYQVRGSLFFGMLITSIVAWIQGTMVLPDRIFAVPHGLDRVAGQLDIVAVFGNIGLLIAVFTILLMILFDTTGMLLAVGEAAGLVKNGRLQRVRGAFMADSIGMILAALLGTTPTSAYAESISGVASGGRTGLTAIVTALLFLSTLAVIPVIEMLAMVPSITAPTLIIVGFYMMSNLRNIEWSDPEESIPAFLTMLFMPLSYSIATGIGIGFIAWPIFKLIRGKWRAVHPLTAVICAAFVIYFATTAYYFK